MKRYTKHMLIILLISILLITTVMNTVIATDDTEWEGEKEPLPDNINYEKIQISLEDGFVPNSTLALDANCDGIVTSRDGVLISHYEAGWETNITDNGITNIDKFGKRNITDAVKVANGKLRMNGCNEFEVGTSITLKAYSSNVETENEQGDPTLITQIGSEALENVTWKSYNEDIVEIDANGNANFKADGFTHIAATTEDGLYSDVLKVYVGNTNELAKLTGGTIVLGASQTKVNLTIDMSSSETTFAGFKGKITQHNYEVNEALGDLTLLGEATQIESKTLGWTVTETSYSSSIEEYPDSTTTNEYTFIVETDDEFLGENNFENIPKTLNIELTIPVNSVLSVVNEGGARFMLNGFQGTDINGTVHDILVTNPALVLYTKITEEVLTVKEGVDPKEISIIGHNIYTKLNSQTVSELFEKIENNLDDFEGYWVEDYDSNILEDDEEVSTGYLYISTKNGLSSSTYRYNLYAMGDICVDSSHSIDINDVMYLRQAIVGKINEKNAPGNFCKETTDVNAANVAEDGTRELRDIGDVIEIRKRIINNKWF